MANASVVKRSETKRKLRISLWLSPEHKSTFERKASKRGLPLALWLLQAALAYERKAERYEAKKEAEQETWASGWAKNQPCPGGGCSLNHDPAWHLANEPRLVRSDNVRRAFAAAGLLAPEENDGY